jgi:hypothetical protein
MAGNVSKFKIICLVIDAAAAIAGVALVDFMNRRTPISYWFFSIFSSCDLSHFNR